jgi:hypothetical protein
MAIEPGVGFQLVRAVEGNRLVALLLAAGETAGSTNTSIRPAPAIAVASRIICSFFRAEPEQNLRVGYSS